MSDPRPRPLVGGYYWFLTPTTDGTAWAVRTCHDLRFDAEVGHVANSPAVVDQWVEEVLGFR